MLGDLSIPGMEETRRLIMEAYPNTAVTARSLDVSNEKVVEEFYSHAASLFGRIDYAANVAGVPHAAAPIHQMPDAVFDKVYAVNQRGVRMTLGSDCAASTDNRGFSVRTRDPFDRC